MFFIEIERATGSVFEYAKDGVIQSWEVSREADEVAEGFWVRFNESGRYARFSVIDSESGESVSDWEC